MPHNHAGAIPRLLAAVADWLADRWDPAFELDGLTEEDE